MDSKYYIQFHN